MKFSNIFKERYYSSMLRPAFTNPVRNRADNFQFIFEYLEKIESPVIVETGVMRGDHGDMAFGDDGCSTFLFDQFINIHGGSFTTVDISENNCNHARSKISNKSTVTCSDSIPFLWNFQEKVDMVYLDSYDIEFKNPVPSQVHHIKELACLLKNLKKGSLIVIDDHDAFFTNGQIGKGTLVKEFMAQIGKTPIFENYQIGFIF